MYSRIALLLGALSSAACVAAAPAPVVNDTSILNYALTLEYLERSFYEGGLDRFCAQDFIDAGFPPWVRGRFRQIRAHEETHVDFLLEALQAQGATPVEPCNYTFPYTDVPSWVALSMTLETVGTGAYMGAGRFVSDKDVLVASQSIGQVEARHAGWVSSTALHVQPWDGAFETPLYFSGVFSLAIGFIESCPASNPALPVTAFPALTVSNSTPAYGDNITLSWNSTGENADGAFLAWYSGLNTTFTPIVDNMTTVPDLLRGTVFAGVVANQSVEYTDVTMLTGLAVLSFPFSAFATDNA